MAPSGPRNRTVAVGMAWEPVETCTRSRRVNGQRPPRLAGYDCLDIPVVHDLLAVRDLLESGEDVAEFPFGEFVSCVR